MNDGLPDGAQWLVAITRCGLRGDGELPHGHPKGWLWDFVTRPTLDYALQGLKLRLRRHA